MKRKCLQTVMAVMVVCVAAGYAGAHCEIPCGIYDDQMRIHMIAEHITTIEKSMTQITELAGQKAIDHHQLTRWTVNKENHADLLQDIVSQYFMTQRIKPDAEKYAEKISTLHKMLISAMKCKQTTDLSNVSALRSLLKDFETLYFGEKK